jgi:hypothetical protein
MNLSEILNYLLNFKFMHFGPKAPNTDFHCRLFLEKLAFHRKRGFLDDSAAVLAQKVLYG